VAVILAERYRNPASSRVCAGRKLASRIFFESAPKSRLGKWPQVADLHQEKPTRLGQTCTGPSSTAEERDASNNVTKRFFGAGEQIGGINYYFTHDHLGSVREMTDSTRAVRARYEYDPYGRQTKVSGDLESDFGFTGFYRHQASGLNLTLFRAYDPELGRWINRDPIAEMGGMNLYAYCENNPISYVDLLGLKWSIGGNIYLSKYVDSGGVLTDGSGFFKIYYGNYEYSNQYIKQSVKMHEMTHLLDALRENNALGNGQRPDLSLESNDDVQRTQSEIDANLTELRYLDRVLSDGCSKMTDIERSETESYRDFTKKLLDKYKKQNEEYKRQRR